MSGILGHDTTEMNCENITLREMSQMQKDDYCTLPLAPGT
jgi:hypothetical protein